MAEFDRPKRERSRAMQIFMDNLLIILIILAVAIGVMMGLLIRQVWPYYEFTKIWYLEFPGRLLVSMLKMLILPLIISSLVVGMASIGGTATGKLGAGAVIYYMTTTLFAVVIGIVLVLTIRPGDNQDRNELKEGGSPPEAQALDSLLDLISQCFPENLVEACFERRVTQVGLKDIEFVNETEDMKLGNETKDNKTDYSTYTVAMETRSLTSKSGTNVLGIVVFSIALGCVINHLGEEGKPLKNFFLSLNAATMVLINIIIWYTPIGIAFLVAGKFISTEDIEKVLSQLGLYFVTVVAGLAIHGFIILPLIFFVTTRMNPFKFMLNMSKALLTAWGTASSSATLPITMDCLINKNKVNINVVRFVAPVGATINMDGTALYEAVACIFIAQINNIDLSVAEVIIVSLTATAAAIGAAGVPQAGLVTLVIVLTSVGLPSEDITYILAIDWFLDRFRTAINVWGDSVGCGILNHLFKKIISSIPEEFSREMEEEISSSDDQNSDKMIKSNGKMDNGPPAYDGYSNEGFDGAHPDHNTRM